MTSVVDRFLKYVSFDTQSDETSETCPSTMKQKDLGAALVEEMLQMGIADARMDDNGYVYGTVPVTPACPPSASLPTWIPLPMHPVRM